MALSEAQREDGSFDDPVKGRVGGGGMPQVAFAALRQAARLTGEPRQRRIALAQRTLSRGANDEQLLPKWPLAMLVLDGAHVAIPNAERWQRTVTNLGRLRAPGVANACYRDGLCFNNYDLVSAVLNMELARTGARSTVKGARLHDRALRRHTLQWLRDRLPRTTSATARLSQPGLGARRMSALSDPSTYPLAYHAFSAALLTRAVALGGRDTPAAVRRLLRRSLWQLVAFTAPNGETSWMGRGQDQVWTLAAAAYSGIQGSVLLARSDPALAARLRRLADVELAALKGRLGDSGLRQTPLGRAGRAGIDHYACSVGNAAHALVWLELAREIAPQVRGARRALPAQTDGARASDPRSTGLTTLRSGPVWIAVHRRRSHRLDERYDFGLLRALVRGEDGSWIVAAAGAPDRAARPRELAERPAARARRPRVRSGRRQGRRDRRLDPPRRRLARRGRLGARPVDVDAIARWRRDALELPARRLAAADRVAADGRPAAAQRARPRPRRLRRGAVAAVQGAGPARSLRLLARAASDRLPRLDAVRGQGARAALRGHGRGDRVGVAQRAARRARRSRRSSTSPSSAITTSVAIATIASGESRSSSEPPSAV